MSNIYAAIRDHLKADAGVSDLVDSRVRVGAAGSSDLRDSGGGIRSFIVIWGGIDTGVHHMTGASGLSIAMVQIDCVGKSDSDAHAVSEAVRSALDGRLSGIMGREGIDVDSVILNNRRPDYEPPADGSARGIFKYICECTASYRQSVPLPV